MRKKMITKILTHIVLILVSAFALFPIYFILWTSLAKIPLAALSSSILPNISLFTFSNYLGILRNSSFLLWTRNSLIFGLSSAAIGIGLAAFTGYALSRFNFPGRRVLIYFIIGISLFPGIVLIIPYYFMFAKLNLIDTYIGLIIPYSAGSVIFSGILVKNYIDSIPEDLDEAALVDGYTRTGAFFRVILPLSKPILALGVVLAFVGPYTDYALANAFITSSNLWTLALGLYKTSQTVGVGFNYGIFSAFSFLMGLPILIIYLVFQRYIISGLTLGGVKG
jgi:arabinogalactan oligomer/maltooligosaccharide transport system permease protein